MDRRDLLTCAATSAAGLALFAGAARAEDEAATERGSGKRRIMVHFVTEVGLVNDSDEVALAFMKHVAEKIPSLVSQFSTRTTGSLAAVDIQVGEIKA